MHYAKKKYTTEMMKEYISESLLLLMSKRNYDDIAIGEITQKAGVNRSTYYRNFKSKDDIIKFYVNKIINEYLSAIERGNKISLQEYLFRMFSHFYEHKNELLRIYKSGLTHLILDALNDIFATVSFENTFEERYKIYYHTGGVYNCFLLWFSIDMEESPKRMSEISAALLPSDFTPMLLRMSSK